LVIFSQVEMNNFYWNIASKISRGKGIKKGFSRPIILIATSAVTLGIAVIIISISIVRGFQGEVREKVVGFGAHVQISSNQSGFSKESLPLLYNDTLVREIRNVSSVKNVQRFAIKPGILETRKDIEGSIIKGVGKEFDWSFFKSKLLDGITLDQDSAQFKKSVVISQTIANRLELEVGDKLSIYFVLNESDAKPKVFRVVGIFNSGFKEFDEQFVFVPLSVLSKVSQWGLEAQVKITDSETNPNNWQVEALGFGGKGSLLYSWSEPNWSGKGPFEISKYSRPKHYWLSVRDRNGTYPDTANFSTHTGEDYEGFGIFSIPSKGSYNQYTGGYEILLDNYESILNADDELTYAIPYTLKSETILRRFPEIFQWLSTLDLNVFIIISLMIFVAIINMASAVLIIILEKTNLIGLFKAFGSTTRQLSKVFMVVAFRIFALGLFLGNIIGIGVCLLQEKFGFIKLDEANYYLNKVPMDLSWMRITDAKGIFLDVKDFFIALFQKESWHEFRIIKRLFYILDWHIYGLNLFVLIICLLCMFIPLLYVARINPVKAIKFD